jgi:hypothetical protein
VNEDDDGSFGFDFGVYDEGLDGAVTMLERDVFVMTRGGFETSLSPILRMDRSGGKGKEESCSKESDGARRRESHGEECSTRWMGGTRCSS